MGRFNYKKFENLVVSVFQSDITHSGLYTEFDYEPINLDDHVRCELENGTELYFKYDDMSLIGFVNGNAEYYLSRIPLLLEFNQKIKDCFE